MTLLLLEAVMSQTLRIIMSIHTIRWINGFYVLFNIGALRANRFVRQVRVQTKIRGAGWSAWSGIHTSSESYSPIIYGFIRKIQLNFENLSPSTGLQWVLIPFSTWDIISISDIAVVPLSGEFTIPTVWQTNAAKRFIDFSGLPNCCNKCPMIC